MTTLTSRRKLLTFRVLDGRLRSKTPARAGAYYALAFTCLATVTLCAANDPEPGHMRGMMQAAFCVMAALFYCAWSFAWLLYHGVHECMSEDSRSYRYTIADNDDEEAKPIAQPEEEDEVEEEIRMMPREVVISTMYLGGTGVFLSIAALCMWDCALTIAFLLALLFIAILDFETDGGGRRTLLGWALCVALALTLALTTAIEATSGRSPEGEVPLWPFLGLCAVSPFMLRAAGGGVHHGGLFHSLTPVQTLETGLPVTVLLGALLLSWFGLADLQEHLLAPELMRSPVFWCMALLVPNLLGSSLAFLLYALRKRDTLHAVAVMVPVLVVRQHLSHGASMLGPAALGLAGLCLLLLPLRLMASPTPKPPAAE